MMKRALGGTRKAWKVKRWRDPDIGEEMLHSQGQEEALLEECREKYKEEGETEEERKQRLLSLTQDRWQEEIAGEAPEITLLTVLTVFWGPCEQERPRV